MTAESGNQNSGEILSLTTLRGLLACWVVVYHFWNELVLLFPGISMLTPVAGRGGMAVPAFFMLSGFVLTLTYSDKFGTFSAKECRKFLMRRLARIYPVHLVSLLVVLAMVRASGPLGISLTDSGYTSRDFVMNIFLVQTWVPNFSLNWNYPSWSISSEWFAYLLFPFLVLAVTRLKLTTPARAAALSVLALSGNICFTLFCQPLPFHALLLVVPTFVSGMSVCWMVRRQPAVASPVVRWSGVALACALVGCCFLPHDCLVVTGLLTASLGLIALLGWSRAACHPAWRAPLAVFIGDVSYSLYMTHTLAQKVLYKVLPTSSFAGESLVIRLVVLIGYIGSVVLGCLLMYGFVEKPCRRFLNSFLSNRPPGGRRDWPKT